MVFYLPDVETYGWLFAKTKYADWKDCYNQFGEFFCKGSKNDYINAAHRMTDFLQLWMFFMWQVSYWLGITKI